MINAVTAAFGSSESFRLDKAILVYSGDQRAYATIHDVSVPGKPGMIGPGQPATRAGIRRIVEALGHDAAFAGFVHPRTLYIGKGTTIWWWPATPRRVWFQTPKEDKEANVIGTRSGITVHPNLVFAVCSGTWFVFALREPGRPGEQMKLCRAPYFNVYENGSICEGNVHPPAIDGDGAIEAHERLFFDTRFTHPNVHAPHKLVDWKGGATALWTHLLDRGPALKAFPAGALVDLNLRLKDLPGRVRKETE